MKKFKLLSLETFGVIAIATAPLATLCITSAAAPTTVVSKLNAAQKAIFDIDDATGTLKGFKKGISKKEISDYCKDSKCILPAGITKIGKDAFNAYKNRAIPDGIEVIIPDSCIEIGDYAFYSNKITGISANGNDGLSYTSIGDSAFSNCSEISSFKFPIGFNKLGKSAFSGCTKLDSLDFTSFNSFTTKGLLNIEFGDNAFSGVKKTFGTILVNGQSSDFATSDVNDANFGRFLSNLYAAGLTGIYDSNNEAWSLSGYTAYDYPSGVYHPVPVQWLKTETVNGVKTLTGIQPKRLADVKKCNTVLIPSDIKAIDASKFTYFKGSSTIAKSVGFTALWCEDNSISEIPDGLCENNNSSHFDVEKTLTYVRFPKVGLTRIGKAAFKNCEGLFSITINDVNDLTKVDDQAFQNCKILRSFSFDNPTTKLSLCNKVNYVGAEAFDHCEAITELKLWDPQAQSENDKPLVTGVKCFGNLNSLQLIDMSAVNYAYKTIDGKKQIDPDCTFFKWYDSPQSGDGTSIFYNLPFSEPNARNISLPKTMGSESEFINPATFMDTSTSGDKEHAKDYSGFYWLCKQSTTDSTDWKKSQIFDSWTQSSVVQITGTQVLLEGSNLTSEDYTVVIPEGSSFNSIILQPVGDTVLPSTDKLELQYNQETKKAKIVVKDLGLNIEENGVYTFRIVANYTKDSETITGYSDTIMLYTGYNLIYEWENTSGNTLSWEKGQAQSTKLPAIWTAKFRGEEIEGTTYSIKKVEGSPELPNTLHLNNQTGEVTWDNEIPANTYKFTISASSMLKVDPNQTIMHYTGTNPEQITLEIKDPRELVINDEVTSISTEEHQAGQATTSLTAKFAGGEAMNGTSTWSIVSGHGEWASIDNTGLISWNNKIPQSASGQNLKVQLHFVEDGTGYAYDAFKEIPLTITSARPFIIDDGQAKDISYEIGQKALSGAPTTYQFHAYIGSDKQAPTGDLKWSLKEGEDKPANLIIGETTGILDWSGVTTAWNKAVTVCANFKEANTGYTYGATISVNLKIDAARTLSIGGGVTSLWCESGQKDGSTSAFVTTLSGSSVTSSWTMSGAPNGISIDSNSGVVSWSKTPDVTSGASATIRADYTDPTTRYGGVQYKYYNTKTMSVKVDGARSLSLSNPGSTITQACNASTSTALKVLCGTTDVTSGVVITKVVGTDGNAVKGVSISDKKLLINNVETISGKQLDIYGYYTDSTSGHAGGASWTYGSAASPVKIGSTKLTTTSYAWSDATWNTISDLCHKVENGTFTNLTKVLTGYTVGSSTKNINISLNGDPSGVYSHQLVLADASDKAGGTSGHGEPITGNTGTRTCLTFLFNNILTYKNTSDQKKYPVNFQGSSNNTNNWRNNALRSYLSSKVSDIETRNNFTMTSCHLTTYKGGNNKTEIQEDDDKLYNPSLTNIFSQPALNSPLYAADKYYSASPAGTSWKDFAGSKAAIMSESTQYKYFANTSSFKKFLGLCFNDQDDNKLKVTTVGDAISGGVYAWWLRTPWAIEYYDGATATKPLYANGIIAPFTLPSVSLISKQDHALAFRSTFQGEAYTTGSGGYGTGPLGKKCCFRPVFCI